MFDLLKAEKKIENIAPKKKFILFTKESPKRLLLFRHFIYFTFVFGLLFVFLWLKAGIRAGNGKKKTEQIEKKKLKICG